jgi:hypothetical protein
VFGLWGLPARPSTDDGLKVSQVHMLLGLVCPPVCSTHAARFSQQAWESGSCAPTAQSRFLPLPESGFLIVFAPLVDGCAPEARGNTLRSPHFEEISF